MFLPSEEDCFAPEENLEQNSSGLKSSQSRGVTHKPLQENQSAWIKERSLLDHMMCLEETQNKTLDTDILTEIGKGETEKTEKEKLAGTEIHCRFIDSETRLNFRKRAGPLRNEEEPILVTTFPPELSSDQAVKLAFSYVGEVVSVFKGRHEFN